MLLNRCILLLAVVNFFQGAASTLRTQAQTYGIDLIDTGVEFTVPARVNNFGHVVGWFDDGTGHYAFAWDRSGGMVDLGRIAGGQYSEARDVNERGEVVGFFAPSRSSPTHAFFWDANGGIRDLGQGFAYGVSGTDELTGNAVVAPNVVHAVRWDARGAMTDLGSLGGTRSYAYDVNDLGQIIGSSTTSPETAFSRAFLWTSGARMRALPASEGAINVSAAAINNLGDVAGSVDARAAIWIEGTQLLVIGALTGNSAAATAINDGRQVVGWWYEDIANTRQRAFIWDPSNGARDLTSLLPDGSGWTHLFTAQDINDNGQIVGVGLYQGTSRAYLMTPIPEPSTLVLAASALACATVIATGHLFHKGGNALR